MKTDIYKRRTILRDLQIDVFINEVLSKESADLFKETRIFAKTLHNGKSWTWNGRIYLKSAEHEYPHEICNRNDLWKYAMTKKVHLSTT